jgi:hypothetical protein
LPSGLEAFSWNTAQAVLPNDEPMKVPVPWHLDDGIARSVSQLVDLGGEPANMLLSNYFVHASLADQDYEMSCLRRSFPTSGLNGMTGGIGLVADEGSISPISTPPSTSRHIGTPPMGTGTGCRWHKSAKAVGTVSADGHVFRKCAGEGKVRINKVGIPSELSTICMVFDSALRRGGTHQYKYKILEGEIGKADGAGFVFDTQVRRNNIQKMRSVFLNQKGHICLRDQGVLSKFDIQLPPLTIGKVLTMDVDLDTLDLKFAISNLDGFVCGVATVSLKGLLANPAGRPLSTPPNSGFFCAVVTKDVCVALS